MEDLIKALQIFSKYTDEQRPTYCESECLCVNVSPCIVNKEDKEKLSKLGFNEYEGEDYFYSYRFGRY